MEKPSFFSSRNSDPSLWVARIGEHNVRVSDDNQEDVRLQSIRVHQNYDFDSQVMLLLKHLIGHSDDSKWSILVRILFQAYQLVIKSRIKRKYYVLIRCRHWFVCVLCIHVPCTGSMPVEK